MVYLDYALFQQKYFDTQKKYDEILNEQEELFTRTQPKAVQFKEPSGGSGCNVNALDNYLIEKEACGNQVVDEREEGVIADKRARTQKQLRLP